MNLLWGPGRRHHRVSSSPGPISPRPLLCLPFSFSLSIDEWIFKRLTHKTVLWLIKAGNVAHCGRGKCELITQHTRTQMNRKDMLRTKVTVDWMEKGFGYQSGVQAQVDGDPFQVQVANRAPNGRIRPVGQRIKREIKVK